MGEAADRAAGAGSFVADRQIRLRRRQTLSVRYVNTKNKQSFALLTVDGRKLLFVNVMSGSGARYVAEQYTWWNKGQEGNLYSGMGEPNAPPIIGHCKARGK